MPEQSRYSLALVTGASSGIGMAMCRLIASKKIPLIVTGRNVHQLEILAEELRSEVEVSVIVADLEEPHGRKILTHYIHQHQPDLIINNAGFGLYGEALTHSVKAQVSMIDVNVIAMLEIALEGARVLQSARKRGVIMNISSAADRLVYPSLAVYAATKAFVTSFSRSFNAEVQKHGIAVLVACPGVINTGFRLRASGGKLNAEGIWAMSAETAAKKIWCQIESGKRVNIFDWKTRVGMMFTYLLPEKWISKILTMFIVKNIN